MSDILIETPVMCDECGATNGHEQWCSQYMAPDVSVYEQLMATESLLAFRTILLENNNYYDVIALTGVEIAKLQLQVKSLYYSLSSPTADDEYYYEELIETLSVLNNYDAQIFSAVNDVYLSDNTVYYLDSKTPVTSSAYENMLVDAINNNGDVPITNWRRSSGEYFQDMPKPKENANISWNWSFLGSIDLNLTNEHDVWDGSRLLKANNTYELRQKSSRLYEIILDGDTEESHKISALYNNGHPVLYDSATWGLVEKDKYNINRFQGIFVINEDPNLYEFTFGNVVVDDYMHINDDIFIFCYPYGTELTNDNFMDYFVCWGGTSAATGRNMIGRFNGVAPSGFGSQEAHSSAVDMLSDKWTIEVSLDTASTAIKNTWASWLSNHSDDGCKFVIDIFTTEAAGSGGMYRPVIKKTIGENYREIVFHTTCSNHNIPVESAVFGVEYDGLLQASRSDKTGVLTIPVKSGINDIQILKQIGNCHGFNPYSNQNIWVLEDNGNYSVGTQSSRYGETNPYVINLNPYEYQVTLDGNGGVFANNTSRTIINYCSCGHCEANKVPLLIRPNYIFTGWKILETQENTNWTDDVYNTNPLSDLKGKYGNVILVAQWSEDGGMANRQELHYHSVLIPVEEKSDIKYNTGIFAKWISFADEKILRKEDCDNTTPTWGDLFPKYEFVGWENNPETDTDEVVNLYAIWEKK